MDAPARQTPTEAPALPRSRPAWPFALVLVLAVLGVYSVSLRGPFLFDDFGMGNAIPTKSRPLLAATFQLNRLVSETDTLGYHLVNVAIHAAAGLVLFGVLRRVKTRGGAAPSLLPAAVALLWALHPLQTGAVSYIVQRAESLASLFFLLALYAFQRWTGGGRAAWSAASLAAFACGMATKEIVAPLPLVLLLYDRAFVAGSFGAALRRRAGFYAALAALWAGLFAWLILPGLGGGTTSGFGVEGLTPLAYLRTQPGVLVHYLRLVFWPVPQCLDYAWPLATTWDPLATGLVLALLAVTAVGVVRNSWWGFAGAWFFVILAPTSSVMPIADPAFEHRMYLPLAAVLLVATAALFRFGARVAAGQPVYAALLVVLCAIGLGARTAAHNFLYRSPVAMWSDVVAQRPENGRGFMNLAIALANEQRWQEAAEACERSVALRPTDTVYLLLGDCRAKLGQLPPAIAAYDRAEELFAFDGPVQLRRGAAYLRLGDAARALPDLEAAALAFPTGPVRYNLGSAYLALRRPAQAEVEFRAALAQGEPNVERALGHALFQQRKFEAAAEAYRAALAANPGDAESRANLDACRAALGERR